MDTKTIIYVVAGALILRVIVKLIFKFYKEQSNPTSSSESNDQN